MSDNLKRAESLFNRIMNQSTELGNVSPVSRTSSPTPSQNHHHQHQQQSSQQQQQQLQSQQHQQHQQNSQQNSSQSYSSSNHSRHHSNSRSRHHHHHNNSHHYNNNNHHTHSNHHNHNHNHSHPSYINLADLAKLPKLDVQKLTQEALSTTSNNDHVLAYCWTIWHHSRNKKQQQQLQQQQQQQQQQQLQQLQSSTPLAELDFSEKENETEAAATTDTATALNNAIQIGVDSYLQTTNQVQFANISKGGKSSSTLSSSSSSSTTISHVASVEQMWTMLSTIKNSFKLNIGTEFLIFKAGINPVWEDPLNAKGGRWVFRFSRKSQDFRDSQNQQRYNASLNNGSGDLSDQTQQSQSQSSQQQSVERLRKRSALIWERIVIKILTGNFIPQSHSAEIQSMLLNDISGIVLSVRKDEDIISVWNSNLNFLSKKQMEAKMNKYGNTSNSSSSLPFPQLSAFHARRIMCDAILRIIRECDTILDGGPDGVTTLDSGSNERVMGVSFEYRLHVEAPAVSTPTGNGGTSNGNHNSEGNTSSSVTTSYFRPERERGAKGQNGQNGHNGHNSKTLSSAASSIL